MKKGIHPKYEKSIISCACGNSFETGSTKKNMKVEICSICHPFFTGKQKMIDTAGRVERFNKKYILMNDCKNKSMKEKEILFENICIEIMNLFKYKKTELL